MNFNYQCIECRKCEEHCSIFIATGKYGPIEKLKIIDELRNDIEIDNKKIQTIFNCTKCEACQSNCPQEIPFIKLYDWARHKIKTVYGLRNKKQLHLIQNIVNFGNPFGNEESRLKGTPLDLVKNKIENGIKSPNPKILLHLGCMLGYRLNSKRDDVLTIFNLLDINYNLLENENCCGYFVWNTGDHETAKKIINKNCDDFKQYDKIICACAGCYTFFKEHYPDKTKFYHSIEVIDDGIIQLINQGRINSKIENKSRGKSMVFHDSCHLTRPHNIINPPRRILNTMGLKFGDFYHSGVNGLCCGADGGLRIVNLDLAVKIGCDRVEEAKELKSDEIVTLCPFCIFNFRDGIFDEATIEVQSLYYYIRIYLESNLKKK